MSLADWMAWGGFVSLSVAVGLAIFWGVGAFYHLRYYRARADAPETWKCQPKRFLKPAQQREAMIMSSSALSMGGIISGSIVFLLSRGLETPLYYRVSDHGWLYTIASSLLFFVVVEVEVVKVAPVIEDQEFLFITAAAVGVKPKQTGT